MLAAMRLTLLDWRRQVARLYADVRAAPTPADGHDLWRAGRDRLLAEHPDSPLEPADRTHFTGLPVAPYDPALRFDVELDTDVTPPLGGHDRRRRRRPASPGSAVAHLPGLGDLDVWWLESYGGGVFVPVRDPARTPTAAAATCWTPSRAPTSAATPRRAASSSTSTSPTTRPAPTPPRGPARSPPPATRLDRPPARRRDGSGTTSAAQWGRMIRGYVEQPSPRRRRHGDAARRHGPPRFRVDVHRCGPASSWCTRTGWLPAARRRCTCPGTTGAGRTPACTASRSPRGPPTHWRSAAVGARASTSPCSSRGTPTGTTGRPRRSDATRGRRRCSSSAAPTAAESAPILYKLPLLTYHAYDLAGGEPYDAARADRAVVLLQRAASRGRSPSRSPPASGCTALAAAPAPYPYDVFNTDPFDPTPRQTYVHWDAAIVAWLERSGYDVDYCTDVDLHREGVDLLAPHRLLVSVGSRRVLVATRCVRPSRTTSRTAATWPSSAATRAGGGWSSTTTITFERLHFWHEPGHPRRPGEHDARGELPQRG